MKIDIASLIIAVLALGSFFGPIAWYQISQKKKIKKVADKLMQFADEHKIALTSHEIWGDNYAIGMNEEAKKLLYFKLDDKADKKIVIDLTEIENCKVSNVTKTINGQKQSVGITNNIRLLFHYHDSRKGPAILEIYDGENGKTLTTEITVANKWSRTVNSLLKSHSEKKQKLPLL